MPAIELLSHFTRCSLKEFSREETLFLEAELFVSICEELKEIFRFQYKNYFRAIKFNMEMEDVMIEEVLVRLVINDILSTEEYSLSGIAFYTHTPEDIIYEIAIGKNTNPSSRLLRKIIELHRTVRPSLYRDIRKKIITPVTEEYNS